MNDGKMLSLRVLVVTLIVALLLALGVTALLVTIFEHRQEARTPFVRMVEVDELSSDSVPWANNWPYQFDTYRRTVDTVETQYGGSSAMPESKLDASPWLRRLYAGYAFSIDYREARGHAYMLYDQEVTERVTKAPQPGACLHCHASVLPTYRRLGLEQAGLEASPTVLAGDFNWPAVMKGFERMSTMTYAAAHAELRATADGTPGENEPLFPGGRKEVQEQTGSTVGAIHSKNGTAVAESGGEAHPVGCLDCHNPQSMQVRVTRPGFIRGIAALAASDTPVPHLPSIERWRSGDRKVPYDPNLHAGRQELRSFVCGQCHVEYYCGPKEVLFFPWHQGLQVEQIEAVYEKHRFPDGNPFYDYQHGETGAKVFKAQHPEFELWSQGVHARSGVACADCHMPYERVGAMKVSNHWVKSPLLSINSSCQTCHNVPEAELQEKVETIQGRTSAQLERAAQAMTEMLDAINEAKAAGIPEGQLAPIYDLQKKAMFRLDFISSENSLGFHADQEAMRVLAESIEYSRQAQAGALRLRVSPVTGSAAAPAPVLGVTPTEKAPPGPYRTSEGGSTVTENQASSG